MEDGINVKEVMNTSENSSMGYPLKVLIFPCGTEIGLEIYRSLIYCKEVELFGATSLEKDVGVAMFENYFSGLPFVDDPKFLDTFNSLLNSYRIDVVFPAHDAVCLALAQVRDTIPSKILTSPYETCVVCRNKAKTYQFFKGCDTSSQGFRV